jgi:GntR family transcriptional regulator
MEGKNRQPGFGGLAVRQIDRGSPVPYYYQLQEILKEEIENGRWRSGETLPSEVQLATVFGISRTVIRNALDVLEADGQVFRVRGKGTVVAHPKFRYEGVSSARQQSGAAAPARPRLLKLIDCRLVTGGGHVGGLLDLAPRDSVLELTIAQSMNDVPASLGQMFLRPDASESLQSQIDRAGGTIPLEEGGPDVLVQLAEHFGIEIVESKMTVEATQANAFEAEILGMREGSPMFLLSSLDLRFDALPVAFTRSVVRSDQFRFAVVLRVPEDSLSLMESVPLIGASPDSG